MSKQKNIDTVSKLKDKLTRAKSVVVTDYRGLTHKQAEELHRTVKKVGGEYLVAKNSLLSLASTDTGNKMEKTELTGTTAVLLSYEDEVSPLKELAKFAKTGGLPKIKFGIMAGSKYDDSQVATLSKLPGRQELQAMVVGRLSGPMYGLLYALNGNLNKLVYVLTQIKK